jgi:hypothetical protein
MLLLVHSGWHHDSFTRPSSESYFNFELCQCQTNIYIRKSYSSYRMEMLRCAVAVTLMILRDHLKHKGNRREGIAKA